MFLSLKLGEIHHLGREVIFFGALMFVPPYGCYGMRGGCLGRGEGGGE